LAQGSSKAGQELGMTLEPSAGGYGGAFIPDGIRWVVERSWAWLARYRQWNTIFERTKEHLVAFVQIAFVSILVRRLNRLVTEQLCS
jgi:hypothetical protein